MDEQNIGANEEEFAEPLSQEPEEPDGIEWEPFDSDKEPSEETPEVAEPVKEEPTRDLDKDKAFAELRRAKEDAERVAAEAKRKADAADAWVKENYGAQGLNTWEDYQRALVEERKRQEYESKGMDYDEVRKAIKEELESHPQVVKAKEEAQRIAINSEIRALKDAYPELDVSEVSNMADLIPTLEKLPGWEQIQAKVAKGHELKDAYFLVHQDEIIAKRTAAAEQAARNKIQSKAHLKPSANTEYDDAVMVPPETMAVYERMFARQLKDGTMTREKLISHYKKENRRGG